MSSQGHRNDDIAKEQTNNTVTAKEMTQARSPVAGNSSNTNSAQKRPNACTQPPPPSFKHLVRKTLTHVVVAELMSNSKKPKPTVEVVQSTKAPKNAMKTWDPRNGLSIYIDKPETNPEGLIVEYDSDFVVINDKFPKARSDTTHPKPHTPPSSGINTKTVSTSSSSPATQTTTPPTPSTCSPRTPPSSQTSAAASTS